MMISYARASTDLLTPLYEKLREVGIPLWRDTENLGYEPASDAIIDVLRSHDTAGVILFATPAVRESDTICNVEAPEILDRVRKARAANDPFFLVPVAAGGLRRGGIAQCLRTQRDHGQIDLTNMERLPRHPSEKDLQRVAQRLLQERVKRIHDATTTGQPLNLSIFSRRVRPFVPGDSLTLDHSHLLVGHEGAGPAWKTRLLPALEAVYQAIAQAAPGRALRLNGDCTLPLACAIGAAFRLTRNIPTSWQQATPQGLTQEWSNASAATEAPFSITAEERQPGARDLLVAISIRNDVHPAITRTPGLPPWRRIVDCRPTSGAYPSSIADAGQAAWLAESITNHVRTAANAPGAITRAHLFISGPAGLAYLVGQRLNALPLVQTYEFRAELEGGRYEPACLFNPSGNLADTATRTRSHMWSRLIPRWLAA